MATKDIVAKESLRRRCVGERKQEEQLQEAMKLMREKLKQYMLEDEGFSLRAAGIREALAILMEVMD